MNKKIIKAPALKQGDCIGVCAPSFPFPTKEQSAYYQQYLIGKAELINMGFEVIEANNLHKIHWWSAGTPEERAQDINNFYADPKIKAIIAHDGGNDCIRVLELLDFNLIKNNPKPFIGFSNITNIHLAVYSKVGLVGFHMGLLTYELGNFWQQADYKIKDQGQQLFKSILTNNKPIGSIKARSQWQSWRSGSATGRLLGGNLSMIDSLVGSPFFPNINSFKGSIFFWEIDNSPTYRIERILTHLKYAKILKVISGMMIGKLVEIKPSTEIHPEPSVKEIVLECTKDFSFPILAEVDFGHQMVQTPMPIGIKVEIDSDKKQLSFLEAAVK